MLARATVRAELPAAEAHAVLASAWLGGKNRNDPLARFYPPHDTAAAWVVIDIPLDWIRANEAGDRYDGTVNPERASAYAQVPHIDAPVWLLFGPRLLRQGHLTATVMDGGHRTSAARQRGDTTLPAIMRATHFEMLVSARAEAGLPVEVTRSAPQPARGNATASESPAMEL